jgi:hypothetical protein
VDRGSSGRKLPSYAAGRADHLPLAARDLLPNVMGSSFQTLRFDSACRSMNGCLDKRMGSTWTSMAMGRSRNFGCISCSDRKHRSKDRLFEIEFLDAEVESSAFTSG